MPREQEGLNDFSPEEWYKTPERNEEWYSTSEEASQPTPEILRTPTTDLSSYSSESDSSGSSAIVRFVPIAVLFVPCSSVLVPSSLSFLISCTIIDVRSSCM